VTHHPDRGGNAETFKDLNKAYEVDSQKHAIYDEGGEEALAMRMRNWNG
jgi:DnaJ-class molecular chaperone